MFHFRGLDSRIPGFREQVQFRLWRNSTDSFFNKLRLGQGNCHNLRMSGRVVNAG